MPGPAESASTRPRASTTITRPPSVCSELLDQPLQLERLVHLPGRARGDELRLAARLALDLGVHALRQVERQRHLERDDHEHEDVGEGGDEPRAEAHSSSAAAKRKPTPRTVWMKRGELRVVAELAAQARDVHVERLGRAEPVDVPDLVDEALARDDGAGLGHQQLEELELLAGEVELGRRRALAARRAGSTPDGADLERRRLGWRCGAAAPSPGAAQHRPDPRGHLARAERLDDVVVGAELEADDAVGLLAAGGEHDDRDARALAQRAADVVAGAVGEHHVEEDEVGHARSRPARSPSATVPATRVSNPSRSSASARGSVIEVSSSTMRMVRRPAISV